MTTTVLEDLHARAYDEAGPLPPVEQRPADAVGSVLREAVLAVSDLPPHEIATADGWVVAGPGPWQLVPESRTADGLPDGCAVAIQAGTAVPAGGSSVIDRHDGIVEDGRLRAATALGDHIRPRASECAAGTLLIPDGTLLTPGAVALAAAGGHTDLLVTGRPTVAVLVPYGTGVDPAAPAAVEALLPSLIRHAGASDVASRRIPDTSVALRSTLDAVHADVVVVAGSGAGERAHHRDHVLADARVDVVIDGTVDATTISGAAGWLLARARDGRLIVALPGDLRGAVAAVQTLVRPLVHGLCGYGTERLAQQRLTADVDGDPGLSSFVFVRDGRPTPDRGPGTGHGVAGADALVLVPPRGAAAGTTVPALPVP